MVTAHNKQYCTTVYTYHIKQRVHSTSFFYAETCDNSIFTNSKANVCMQERTDTTALECTEQIRSIILAAYTLNVSFMLHSQEHLPFEVVIDIHSVLFTLLPLPCRGRGSSACDIHSLQPIQFLLEHSQLLCQSRL